MRAHANSPRRSQRQHVNPDRQAPAQKTSSGSGSTARRHPPTAARTSSSSTRASSPSSRSTSPPRRPSGATRRRGYNSLADTALDFLSVPGKVLADDNRYLSITGCVFHFCPARGLLWVDLGTPASARRLRRHRLGQRQQDPRPSPAPNTPSGSSPTTLSPSTPPDRQHLARTRSSTAIARWTASRPPAPAVVQHITNAILVDPDGTPAATITTAPAHRHHTAIQTTTPQPHRASEST